MEAFCGVGRRGVELRAREQAHLVVVGGWGVGWSDYCLKFIPVGGAAGAQRVGEQQVRWWLVRCKRSPR